MVGCPAFVPIRFLCIVFLSREVSKCGVKLQVKRTMNLTNFPGKELNSSNAGILLKKMQRYSNSGTVNNNRCSLYGYDGGCDGGGRGIKGKEGKV